MVIVGNSGTTNSVIKVPENVKSSELSTTKIVSLIQEEDKKEINYIDVEVEYEEIRKTPKEYSISIQPIKDEFGNIIENRWQYLDRVTQQHRYEGLRVILKDGNALNEYIFSGGITNNDFIKVTTFSAITDSFAFTQNPESTTWIINHNLNRFPKVLILDDTGNDIEGDLKYNSLTQLTINFNRAVRGTAYLT